MRVDLERAQIELLYEIVGDALEEVVGDTWVEAFVVYSELEQALWEQDSPQAVRAVAFTRGPETAKAFARCLHCNGGDHYSAECGVW